MLMWKPMIMSRLLRAQPAFAVSANTWLAHNDGKLKRIAKGWKKNSSFRMTAKNLKFKLTLSCTDERYFHEIAKFQKSSNTGPAVVEVLRGWAVNEL
jgi:hypothetical protein